VDVNLGFLARGVDVDLGLGELRLLAANWRGRTRWWADGDHAMVNIAVVSDNFSLDDRSLDDLRLLRLRRRAGLTLLLPLPLDNANMLTNVSVRRGGARSLAFTLSLPNLKSVDAGRRRAPLAFNDAGGSANPVSRGTAGLADTVDGMNMNV
jgi:hypothetical protein